MSTMHLFKPDKREFIDDAKICEELRLMELDDTLKTESSYGNNTLHQKQLMSFSDKHVAYLKAHPKVNPEHYLANIRTMTKIRPS